MNLIKLINENYNIKISCTHKLSKKAHNSVYITETSKKNKVIIKVFPAVTEQIKRSINLQEKLSDEGIAPKIIKTKTRDKYIVFSKNILFLQEYITPVTEKKIKNEDIITLYSELGNSNIHGDLRPNNVIKNGEHSYFIDFEYFGPGNRSAEILKFLILESRGNAREIENNYSEIKKKIDLKDIGEAVSDTLKEGYKFDFLLKHLKKLDYDYIENELNEHILIIETCLEKMNDKR